MSGMSAAPADTVIENTGKTTLETPSPTRMAILVYVPLWAALGVPESVPVVVLNVAHVGQLEIAYVSGLPVTTLAVG
jgi:hypothetical protein